MTHAPELLGFGLSPIQAGVKAVFQNGTTYKPGVVYPKTPTGTTMNSGIVPPVLRQVLEQIQRKQAAIRPPVQSPPIMPQPTVLLPPVPAPPPSAMASGGAPIVPTGVPIEAGAMATAEQPPATPPAQEPGPVPQESFVKRHWPWLAGGAVATAGVVGFLVLRR